MGISQCRRCKCTAASASKMGGGVVVMVHSEVDVGLTVRRWRYHTLPRGISLLVG